MVKVALDPLVNVPMVHAQLPLVNITVPEHRVC
jgi:hypothetical protein